MTWALLSAFVVAVILLYREVRILRAEIVRARAEIDHDRRNLRVRQRRSVDFWTRQAAFNEQVSLNFKYAQWSPIDPPSFLPDNATPEDDPGKEFPST